MKYEFRCWHQEKEIMLEAGDEWGTKHPLVPCMYFIEEMPVELMLWTGLKDKNNKKLFDKDIVDVYDSSGKFKERYTIIFNSRWGQFEFKATGNSLEYYLTTFHTFICVGDEFRGLCDIRYKKEEENIRLQGLILNRARNLGDIRYYGVVDYLKFPRGNNELEEFYEKLQKEK